MLLTVAHPGGLPLAAIYLHTTMVAPQFLTRGSGSTELKKLSPGPPSLLTVLALPTLTLTMPVVANLVSLAVCMLFSMAPLPTLLTTRPPVVFGSPINVEPAVLTSFGMLRAPRVVQRTRLPGKFVLLRVPIELLACPPLALSLPKAPTMVQALP